MTVEHPYLEERRQRAAVFPSRCSSLPVDIYAQGFVTDGFLKELLLVRDHIGHCRRLSIRDVALESLMMALENLSYTATPALNSINISLYYHLGEDFALT